MENKKAELKLLDMEHNLAGDNAEAYAKKYDRTLLLLKKRCRRTGPVGCRGYRPEAHQADIHEKIGGPVGVPPAGRRSHRRPAVGNFEKNRV